MRNFKEIWLDSHATCCKTSYINSVSSLLSPVAVNNRESMHIWDSWCSSALQSSSVMAQYPVLFQQWRYPQEVTHAIQSQSVAERGKKGGTWRTFAWLQRFFWSQKVCVKNQNHHDSYIPNQNAGCVKSSSVVQRLNYDSLQEENNTHKGKHLNNWCAFLLSACRSDKKSM